MYNKKVLIDAVRNLSKTKNSTNTNNGLDNNFKRGGSNKRPSLPKGKSPKSYSRSFEATNRLFAENPLFKKPKSRKNKIFDPRAQYYDEGGEPCPSGYIRDENGDCVWHDPNQENLSINTSPVHPVEYLRSQLTMGDPFYNTHEVYPSDEGDIRWQPKANIEANLRNTNLKKFIQRDPDEGPGVESGYLHNNIWTSPTLGLEQDTIEPGYAPNQLRYERDGQHPNVYFIKNPVEGSTQAPSGSYTRGWGPYQNKKLSGAEYNKAQNEVGQNLLKQGYKGENMWGAGDEEQLYQLYGTEGLTLKGATKITPETLKYLESIKDSEEGKRYLAKMAGISEDDPDYANMLMHYNTTPIDVYAEVARPDHADIPKAKLEQDNNQTTFLTNTEGPVNYKRGGLTQYAPGGISINLTEDEIQKYVDGGYIVEDDISVPELNQYAPGGAVKPMMDENGEPRCPDGYTYNSSTGYCERSVMGCPDGYEVDPETGKCIEGECKPGYVKNQVGNCVPDVNSLRTNSKLSNQDFEDAASQTCPPNHYYSTELNRCVRYYTADEVENLTSDEYNQFEQIWQKDAGNNTQTLKSYLRNITPKKGDYVAGFVPEGEYLRKRIKKLPEKILTEQVAKNERTIPTYDQPKLELEKPDLDPYAFPKAKYYSKKVKTIQPLLNQRNDTQPLFRFKEKVVNRKENPLFTFFSGYNRSKNKGTLNRKHRDWNESFMEQSSNMLSDSEDIDFPGFGGIPAASWKDLKARREYKKDWKNYVKNELPELRERNRVAKEEYNTQLEELMQRKAYDEKLRQESTLVSDKYGGQLDSYAPGGWPPKSKKPAKTNINDYAISDIINNRTTPSLKAQLINKAITPIGYAPVSKFLGVPAHLIFGSHKPETYALKNRYDAWSVYNGLAPEYNSFELNSDGTLAVKNFDIQKSILDIIRDSEKTNMETAEFNNLLDGNPLNFGGVHGNGYISKGIDSSGMGYIDFTDKWDLQPFMNKTYLPKAVREFEVSQLSGGKPFELKNRIYFDNEGNYFNEKGEKLVETKQSVNKNYSSAAKQTLENPESNIEWTKEETFLTTPGEAQEQFPMTEKDWSNAQTRDAMNYLLPIGLGAAGVIGAAINQINSNNKDKKYGGETDYELGQVVDELTKKKLEELGYTFEKIK